QVILAQLVLRMHFLVLRQVRTRQQVLVNADRTLGLATAAKQVTQRKMQFDRFRIQLDDFDEGIDRLVRLLVQQEIQSPEVATRQAARFGDKLFYIHTRSQ